MRTPRASDTGRRAVSQLANIVAEIAKLQVARRDSFSPGRTGKSFSFSSEYSPFSVDERDKSDTIHGVMKTNILKRQKIIKAIYIL